MATEKFRQNYVERDLENMLHGVTTPLYINHDTEAVGTGFFYYVPPKPNPGKKNTTRPIYEDVWLVTNRHTIFEDDNSFKLRSIKFHTRRIENRSIHWNNYELDMDYLSHELRLPQNQLIDIAIIKVTDKIKKFHPPQNLSQDFGFFAISESLLPESPENADQKVQSGDDVLVIGYPRGILIQENLYPIIKSSCISSKWGSYFDGFPCFIIDRRLVPGSSGSLVITKPTNFTMSNQSIISHQVKQYICLGIYSAEPTPQFVGTDTGLVWYSSLIKDTVLNGVNIN